ncbi:penicillin acylase family protein [Ornithinimicrobium avium]|uniref:Penicillin acylase family protein n=1 Tax=Ornithinimicrobium avium TaxID=2283195 RepID=A0A345NQF1_9MICO|nr:penicillin acylase family protein [Ornithinimicrobium avium]AXH97259.1 penicillin acylase family protein [Ornithinimicrobium avium]
MSRPVWQRVTVPVVAILVVVSVAAAVLGVGLARRSFAQVSGELRIPGLTGEVEVLRDGLGVPQIYADTPEDLFRAQGFVAAQDRFFQMDLRRHVVSGRLAELVGQGGVETDKVIRTLGWRRVAEQELPMLDPVARGYLQAYSAGVNAYIEEKGSPSTMGLEYAVLAPSAPGYRVEPWDPVDSLAWLKAMAWDLRGNYSDELARGRLVGKVSLSQLDELYPDYPVEEHPPILSLEEWAPKRASGAPGDSRGGTSGPVVAPAPGQTVDPADRAGLVDPVAPPGPALGPLRNSLASGDAQDALAGTGLAMAAVPALVGSGEGIGSNSWVVSGEHTESGRPLIANDPHLAVSQPGVWLQTGLHCRVVGPQCPFDVSGFTFAGYPGVIIGHNQSIAWAFTNLDPDVTDFFLEDVREDRVLRGDEYAPMDVRTETIKVAGGDDVTITVRETGHGPIVSDVIAPAQELGEDAPLDGVETSNDYEVSLAWTALEPSRTGEAVFTLNAATDWEGFRDAARLFAAPSQNMLYADTSGNIGYQAPGLVPVRSSATHGTPPGYYPAPGWDNAYDWRGYVDFEDLPWAYNPADGVIVAANQAVVRGTTPFLTVDSDKGYRSTRILDLLTAQIEAGTPLTVEAMTQLQLDDRNPFAEVLVPYLTRIDLGNEFYTQAQRLLDEWDLTAPAEGEQSAAAAYFYAVYDNLLETVLDDELPPDLGASGHSRSMLLLQELLDRPDSAWWDDRRTPGVVESRDEVIRTAMVGARDDLTRALSKDVDDWSWGELHQVRLEHEVLGGEAVPAVVRGIFGQDPQPVSGGSSLVNAMNWDASTDSFEVTSAPSMRMVVDLSDLDASRWVDQTGTSGHPFHPHWKDQTRAWIEGETYAWPFTRTAVKDAAEETLTLLPAEQAG